MIYNTQHISQYIKEYTVGAKRYKTSEIKTKKKESIFRILIILLVNTHIINQRAIQNK